MWTTQALVHSVSVLFCLLVFFLDPHSLCASAFGMKLQTSNKQITEALDEQITKAVYFSYLKNFP